MSAAKTIPLKAVRDAVMLCHLRSVSARDAKGREFAHGAAYTQDPTFLATCRTRASARGLPTIVAHGPFLRRGDMHRVLDIVRMQGLAEVRLTFDAGMRELTSEFKRGVM